MTKLHLLSLYPTSLVTLKAEKRRQKEELRIEREAVKRKAAIEKATARRIARESMELIEDEQLELMELAAASKGLSSMIHLDHDSLQNVELFRGSILLRTCGSGFIYLRDCFCFFLFRLVHDPVNWCSICPSKRYLDKFW